MASIITYGKGKRPLRRIDFNLTRNGDRCTIRLGRATMAVARDYKRHVEAIISNKAHGRHNDPETGEWLMSLDETALAKLRKYGLADGVGLAETSLGAFLERYFKSLTGKPATVTFYGHTRRNLETYFKPEQSLRSITSADADQWRAWLVNEQKLAPATVARRVIAARTLWRAAVRWRLAGGSLWIIPSPT